MVSISPPGITRWGILIHRCQAPLDHLRATAVVCGCLCSSVARELVWRTTRYRECPAPIFQPPVLRDIPIQPRLLVSPRLLTRMYPLPVGLGG